MRHGTLRCLVAAFTALMNFELQGADDVDGASGLFLDVNAGKLVVVGDRNTNRDFLYDPQIIPQAGQVIKLNGARTQGIIYGSGSLDLEDVDELNGQRVVLSESDAAIYDANGPLIDYYSGWPVFGKERKQNQGLEALAVRAHGDGKWDVAIAWEGGDGQSPRILSHTVSDEDLMNRPVEIDVGSDRCTKLRLSSLKLRATLGVGGSSFRVPALVFSRDGKSLIVLVQARKKKWLIRVERKSGHILGHVSFTALGMSDRDEQRNWEGLAWNANNDRLIFITDDGDAPGAVGKHDDETTRLFVADVSGKL